jgi:hypothetical protein
VEFQEGEDRRFVMDVLDARRAFGRLKCGDACPVISPFYLRKKGTKALIWLDVAEEYLCANQNLEKTASNASNALHTSETRNRSIPSCWMFHITKSNLTMSSPDPIQTQEPIEGLA